MAIWCVLALLPAMCLAADSSQQSEAPPQAKTPQSAPAEPAAGKTPSTAPDPKGMSAPAANANAKGGMSEVKSYIIGAEDQLGVSVWNSKELSGPYLVRPDGKITMPLIGDVAAAGSTPEQLQASIAARLKEKYLQSPDVTVLVLAVNSKKFYIHGEVNNPGAYPLIVPTTVLEGLASAHGFRDFANLKKIRILRGNEQFKFNYKDITHGKHTDQNIYLQPGDQIIVP
jgi:polysaccharide export outer membrane protein